MQRESDPGLRILTLKPVERITTLTGQQFVKAWLDAVTHHAFLWKHGVEHGHPTLYNIMVDPTDRSGVLTDFDQGEHQWLDDGPGTDLTGVMPFMAVDLLDPYYLRRLAGYTDIDEHQIVQTPRYYLHELEAFIWIFPFVCLFYNNQKYRSNPTVYSWLTSSLEKCSRTKRESCDKRRLKCSEPTEDFDECWPFAEELCMTLCRDQLDRTNLKWHEFSDEPLSVAFHLRSSKMMWEAVIKALNGLSDQYALGDAVARLSEQEPNFEEETKCLKDEQGEMTCSGSRSDP